jgi:hypothetical protein
LALHRSNSKTKWEISRNRFFSFEEPIEAALRPEKATRGCARPRVIFIVHHQMQPKIGAPEPALAAGPCVTVVVQAANGAGKTARMPEQGRISLIVIANSR